MEDAEGGLPRHLNKSSNFCGRIGTKLPNNPVARLQYRELGGTHRLHNYHRSVTSQIYNKLPARLACPLRNLVDEVTLDEGHVFLGFTKNGHFVLSYTLHVEADEHTAYPIYVFRLHFWRFIPYKKLKKVGEVRLFGEEEIQQDLFIAVCEWPTDDTRIVIHGYCAPSDSEKHQCYVTVTAVPPVGPCDDCNQLAILHAQHGYQGSLSAVPARCLNHAFTVHTKYELAPPYPSFVPKVFLKLDGVVVVNTGDSLIAMSVDIEDNHGGFGFGLYSPRVTRSMSNLSTASSNPSDDQMSLDSHERLSDAKPLEDVCEFSTEPLLNVLGGSPCSNPGPHRTPSTPKDATNNPTEVQMRSPPFRERHASTGKENLLSVSLGSPSDSASSTARLTRSLDVYNFEGSTPKKEEDSGTEGFCDTGPDSDGSGSLPVKPVRTTLSFTGFQQGARMQNTTEEILLQNASMDSQPLVDLEENGPFEKPSAIPRLQNRESASTTHGTQRCLSALSLIPPESLSFGKGLALSPGYGKWEQGGSSTCSSCVSSPIILQSESQCFTYSVRRYIESYNLGRPDSPVDVEDDFNLAYHSLLPLEVHGANYCPMKLLNKQMCVAQTPYVVVKQLTLDIEHYLGETIRQCADWWKRYLAFTDYDVQIVEVCPETSEVIALVFALIRARPPKENKHVHGVRTMPKLYRTCCKLIWNLKTGSYNTLEVDDLLEVNQGELMRKRWHPGQRMCEVLQRRFSVPNSYYQSVHVFTNHSVFRGQSLKLLLDPHHYVAIFL
ncbi:hypothetical protein LSH36_340g06043 [Paralvinella palmiformis]|uniref:DDB1- and CUL4-associated factor 15 WD40 repeat-containing domain-containing protein n=1 Tax=Paralvinella palmiformis TaxID=53620 RepID=A0AAD9JFL7_9ANNE|nr:hypothetical protein LSH36_340g06043 [Paralvinella palmiformis]